MCEAEAAAGAEAQAQRSGQRHRRPTETKRVQHDAEGQKVVVATKQKPQWLKNMAYIFQVKKKVDADDYQPRQQDEEEDSRCDVFDPCGSL